MPPARWSTGSAGLVLALVLLLTACSGSSDAPTSAAPPSAAAPTSSATEPIVPTETAEPVEDPAPPEPDPPTWETQQEDGEPTTTGRYDGDLIGLETRGVVRLTLEGDTVWRWRTPTADDTFPFTVGDVPVVDHVVRGGGHEVSAIDPDTGTVTWSRPSNGSATGDDRRVYAVSCSGRGPARTCAMTAYDVRDGSVSWTTPLEAETDFSKVVTGRVLSRFARGGRFVVLDATNGAVIATGLGRDSTEYVGYETAYRALEPPVLDQVRADRDPSDGCRSTVVLRDRNGSERWTRQVDSVVTTGVRPRCRRLTTHVVDGDVVVTGGRPGLLLLDGGTGKIAWSSELPAQTYGIAGAGVLVVRSDGRLVGIDLRTGQALWTAADDIDRFDYDVAGGYLVGEVTFARGLSQTIALDVRTGELVGRYRGTLQTVLRRRGETGLLLVREVPGEYRSSYSFTRLPRLG